MFNEKTMELLKEKAQNQSFLEQLLGLESNDEVVGFLKTEGIELKSEEIDTLRNMIIKKLESKESVDELSDSDLEEVAGGSTFGLVVEIVDLAVKFVNFIQETTRGRW